MTLPSAAEDLFLAALDRPPGARATFLQAACAGDVSLHARVHELLSAHDRAAGPLDAPPLGEPTAHYAPAADRPGTRLGPYTLLQQLGEGGMGAVWMAEQASPVRRKVAVKVIKAGMDSRQVLARFEAERQALALMDHPNIAKVFDAGATADGRPYFVMELVKGVPITKYCDDRKLAPRERLQLFLPVCHAVQHAHQKGVIHRDLKPSNVLVTRHDPGAPGVPTVIDFGVVKATGPRLTDRTLFTEFGAVVGTPEYMSPEQAELNQLDIDTRSDVYSLGVLLYELLTGTTPVTHQRTEGVALLEVLRIIREDDPPKPSTRLSTLGQAAETVSTNRGTEPRKLATVVKGELDWIVMRALEKDRNRRYESAGTFAADVERYLADEPVLACPPSAGYRVRKFARRNRRALASAALVVGMLLVLFGGLGWVASDRAARRGRAAFEVNQFLRQAESLYADNKLPEALAEVQKARVVLETTGGDDDLRRRVRQWLTDLETATQLEEILMELMSPTLRDRLLPGSTEPGPAARPRVDAGCARVFRNYGIDVEALSTEEAATRIAGSRIKLDLVLALDRWAEPLRSNPRGLDPARSRRLQAISRAADPDPWRLRFNAASEAGDLKTLRELADGADPSRLRPRVLAALGDALRAAGDVEASVAFLRMVQRLHPADYSINVSLAWSLRNLNPPPWDEVIAYRRIAVAVRPHSSAANWYLGWSLHWQQGKLDEAMAYYRTTIALDPGHAAAHFALALALRARGKTEEALVHYRTAVDLVPNDPQPRNNLAWVMATCADPKHRDPAQAVTLARKAVELSVEQGDDRDKARHLTLGNYWSTLGVAHYQAGNLQEAIAALQKSLDIADGVERAYVCENWIFLAMANWKLDRPGEARKWYDRAAAWIVKTQPKEEEIRRFRAEAAVLMRIEETE